jgi:hypothetical protein
MASLSSPSSISGKARNKKITVSEAITRAVNPGPAEAAVPRIRPKTAKLAAITTRTEQR